MTNLETDLTLSEPGRLSPEFLAAIARSKGRTPAKNIPEINAEEILQISEQIQNDEPDIAAPEPAAPVISPPPYEIGELVAGKGVYCGMYTFKRSKKNLMKEFNLFAAPYDLGFDENGRGKRLVGTEGDAIFQAFIKNYMGHNGVICREKSTLYKSLADGTYKGQWFIPTTEMLVGIDRKKNKRHIDNLHLHKDEGALKNSFKQNFFGKPKPYWSLTSIDPKVPLDLFPVWFETAEPYEFKTSDVKARTRLVRLEPKL